MARHRSSCNAPHVRPKNRAFARFLQDKFLQKEGVPPPTCAKRAFVRLARRAYGALFAEESLNMLVPIL